MFLSYSLELYTHTKEHEHENQEKKPSLPRFPLLIYMNDFSFSQWVIFEMGRMGELGVWFDTPLA